MMLLKLVCVFGVFVSVDSVLYDRYTGKKVDSSKPFSNGTADVLGICTADIPPCDPKEFKRRDGYCNNLERPSRGSRVSPYLRMLPSEYGSDGGVRPAKDGEPLPLARKVRTTIYHDGRVVSKRLNMATLHGFEFLGADTTLINGVVDYLLVRRHCCTPAGAADPRCLPIIVPEDDPYYRNQNVRCLNFTRAETFQTLGCLPPNKFPETVNLATTHTDLHLVYGTTPLSDPLIRSYNDGLLRTEYRNNREMPLIIPNSPICAGNSANESVCYNFGDGVSNFDLRFTGFAIMFLKNHNRIARQLKRINPCWNDDDLYNTSRKINIAVASNLVYYELLPALFGRKNLVKAQVIQDEIKFVNEYDPKLEPLIYAETVIALRYFHTLIEGRVKFYNKNYTESNQFFQSNTMLRTDVLERGNNIEEVNRGTFFQRVSRSDDVVDPDVSETMFSTFWRNGDLLSIDIQRTRDMGLRNYNAYRVLCGKKPAKNFEDFHDVMDYDKIDALRTIYNDVDDIDLLAGIVSERLMEGTDSGPTLFYIIQRQFRESRRADRFWYERGDYYHAFTYDQLVEVRKMTLARLACDNADGVEFIQPRAFLAPMKGNKMVPCEHIRMMDLSKWTDKKCRVDKNDKNSLYADSDGNNYAY